MITAGCVNNTIKVAAGHYVDLVNPDPKTIDIKSIAASLSKICRFGGHCAYFYSVAEHCIHCCNLAASDGIKKSILKVILLHDATEAYVGDMVKPLKISLPQYQDAETKVQRAIETAFNVDFDKHHDIIKKYDFIMLKAEKLFMWPFDDLCWNLPEVEDRVVNFRCYEPKQAQKKFLEMWKGLN
jgi:uncharacterized protein